MLPWSSALRCPGLRSALRSSRRPRLRSPEVRRIATGLSSSTSQAASASSGTSDFNRRCSPCGQGRSATTSVARGSSSAMATAAVFRGVGQPFELVEIPIPEKLLEGELLVRME
ncbi:unnamed protein product, partial [Polarella glacialis]